MAIEYSIEEKKELTKQLKQWQNRAKRLILSNYYDSVTLNNLKYTILEQLTNAESYKDINYYLWNSGMIDTVLDDISKQIKKIRESYYRMDKKREKVK
ncbi:hypothetical protein [Clostridium sp. ZBS20]|uniref:hypothetical protein n=1 Tax=Clostridium sp. ZBS20 TaxID=2949966 RepID=UPI00207ADEA2|nr:hypothetical protein [Clostridium sp. ZBS20]